MKRIGYARVLTAGQNLKLQLDALKRTGCHKVYEDKASGVSEDWKGLADALDWAREGDTLVFWRLGRSLKHLVETVTVLNARGVGFVDLQEQIDTTTPGEKLVFHVFCALAEFERNLIRERIQAGLKAARARGRQGDGH